MSGLVSLLNTISLALTYTDAPKTDKWNNARFMDINEHGNFDSHRIIS